MLKSQVRMFGKQRIIACDERCDKAWGMNERPEIVFDEDDLDDFAYLADHELGTAPDCSNWWEGGHNKPQSKEERHNKWCVRACERSTIFEIGEEIVLKDFSSRVYNKHWRQEEQKRKSDNPESSE